MSNDAANLSGALQENVLTLLCFDTEAAAQITGVVSVELFESSVYRRVAERAVEYFRQYKKAPGDHLPDIFEDVLQGDNRDAPMFARTLHDLHSLHTGINRTYVLSELNKFVRLQSLRRSVIEAADLMTKGLVDEAESVIAKGYKLRVDNFNPGLHLPTAIGKIDFYNPTDDLINTGIKPLDHAGICPAPGELYTIMAPPNRGKSWWLIHMGKFAGMQRKRVLHLTLEMSEKKTTARYMQSFFAVSRRETEDITVPVLERNINHELMRIGRQRLRRPHSLFDKEAITKLGKRAKDLQGRMQIYVKQFPTGSLTAPMLRSFIEMLHSQTGFMPDVLIVDYADLMKLDAQNLRIETGAVYRDLRGIAVEYNLAVITATQSNREGEDARILTFKHLAEDYSKAAISDNIVTMAQTKEEYELGLARLYVAKGRDERKGQIVLVTQAFGIGQFCLDGMLVGDEYGDEMIEAAARSAARPHANIKERRQALPQKVHRRS